MRNRANILVSAIVSQLKMSHPSDNQSRIDVGCLLASVVVNVPDGDFLALASLLHLPLPIEGFVEKV